MSVEGVVADVELAVLHPLDLDLAVVDVEVVLQEVLLRGDLVPVKLLQKVTNVRDGGHSSRVV